MFKKIFPGAVGLLVLSMLVAGCGQPKTMNTGTINSTFLLRQDGEYQKLAQQYFDERTKAAIEVEKSVKKQGGVVKDQASYDKLLKMQNDLESKWLKKTRDFTSAKMDSIRTICEKVCKEKSIDIVLIDSEEVPVVEYGAVDITRDIMAEMPGFAGGDGVGQDEKAVDTKATEKVEAGK